MSLMKAFPEILDAGRTEYEMMKAGRLHIAEETGKPGEPAVPGVPGQPTAPAVLNALDEMGQPAAQWRNRLVLGENGAFMKALLQNEHMAGKLQMVYMDPPFFSKARYDAVIRLEGAGEGGKALSLKHPAYGDVWEQGLPQYLSMLAARLYLIRDLLSDEGTIWVHLDWHASHYVRILLDEIFGGDRFVNEIIWTYKSGGSCKRHFARKHDTILVYSKTSRYYFLPLKEKSYNRGLKPYRFKGVEEFQDETGWYTMVNMKDVWQIDMVGRTSSERTGYATQKPEALLERILSCSSREGDLCADFFCGSGTLAAVAQRMNRRWICCDHGRMAAETAFTRLSASAMAHERGSGTGIRYESCEAEGILQAEVSLKDGMCRMALTGYSSAERQTAGPERRAAGENEQTAGADWVTEDGRQSVQELREKDPLRLLESWSIDRNFDGKVHRPDMRILRDKKGKMKTARTFALPEKTERISVAAVDVFGNRYRRILEIGKMG